MTLAELINQDYYAFERHARDILGMDEDGYFRVEKAKSSSALRELDPMTRLACAWYIIKMDSHPARTGGVFGGARAVLLQDLLGGARGARATGKLKIGMSSMVMGEYNVWVTAETLWMEHAYLCWKHGEEDMDQDGWEKLVRRLTGRAPAEIAAGWRKALEMEGGIPQLLGRDPGLLEPLDPVELHAQVLRLAGNGVRIGKVYGEYLLRNIMKDYSEEREYLAEVIARSRLSLEDRVISEISLFLEPKKTTLRQWLEERAQKEGSTSELAQQILYNKTVRELQKEHLKGVGPARRDMSGPSL